MQDSCDKLEYCGRRRRRPQCQHEHWDPWANRLWETNLKWKKKRTRQYQVTDGLQCCCNILNSGPSRWAPMIIATGFMSGNHLGSFDLIKLLVLLLEFLRMEDSQCGGITICNQLTVIHKKTERQLEGNNALSRNSCAFIERNALCGLTFVCLCTRWTPPWKKRSRKYRRFLLKRCARSVANVNVLAFHSRTASSISSWRFCDAADLSLRWVSVRGALRETECRLHEAGRRRDFA